MNQGRRPRLVASGRRVAFLERMISVCPMPPIKTDIPAAAGFEPSAWISVSGRPGGFLLTQQHAMWHREDECPYHGPCFPPNHQMSPSVAVTWLFFRTPSALV
jgi:hypothetical protein